MWDGEEAGDPLEAVGGEARLVLQVTFAKVDLSGKGSCNDDVLGKRACKDDLLGKGSCDDGICLRTRHTLEPLGWHESHWPD